MKIQEVIDRAQKDQQFAEDLHAKALAASRGGFRSSGFQDLLGEFASSPEELANLANEQMLKDAGTTTFTTITTTGTITTLACTVTSTTTTTTTTQVEKA